MHFFESSQWAAGEASWLVGKGSRKRTGVNIFPGYISGRWRDFLQRIDQKPKAVRSCTFSGYRSGPLEWFSVEDQLKSRKLSGGNIFSGYISKGWSGFSQRISPKLEAAWPERLFRAQFRRAGGTFRRVSTQSRRLSGAVLFRVIAAGRLGSLAVGGKRQPEADGC